MTIDLVLAPYLINVKKCDYEIAYNTIAKWLDKCSKKRPLTFNARYKIKYALNHVKNECRCPMRLDTLKSKYPEMYRDLCCLLFNGDEDNRKEGYTIHNMNRTDLT